MEKQRICIYPGSFDPITNGHLDIIERASKLFDKLIVSVVVNYSKQPAFTLEERVELIRKCVDGFYNVEVESFSGLLIDYVKEKKACAIVKGLRVLTDFEYEFQMALLNKSMAPDIETIFMMTNSDYSYISSSMIKEITKLGADISEYVPKAIMHQIINKLR